MDQNINKISALVEFFPKIKNLIGKRIVIKCGGSLLHNEIYLKQLTSDIGFLHYFGIKTVVVHGGGNDISEMCKLYNIPTKFQEGQRVTSKETMEIVQLTLHGKTNRNLISHFIQNGIHAVGMSGQDSFTIKAKKYSEKLGFVGKIEKINPAFIEYLLSGCYLPVISSIASDSFGAAYNINADIAAAEIAAALKADHFILISDVNGIYQNMEDPSSRIPTLSSHEILTGLEEKKYAGGMIPKLEACLIALKCKVPIAHIIDGKSQFQLLLSLLTEQDIGTRVIPFYDKGNSL